MGSPPFINELQKRNSQMWDRLRQSSATNTASAFSCAISAIRLMTRTPVREELKPLFLAIEVLLGALFTEAIANASDRQALAQRLLPLRRDARKVLLAALGPEASARLVSEVDQAGEPIEREELEDLEYRLGLLEAQALALLDSPVGKQVSAGRAPASRRKR